MDMSTRVKELDGAATNIFVEALASSAFQRQHCYHSRMTNSPLLQRGLWLEYATLGWNVIGTVIVLLAALQAGSAALAGFGLDSAIEIFASVVVVWQLKGLEQGRESLALKLMGTAFIALAVYVLVQSVWTLLANAHPAPSPLGIVWLAVTCTVMLLLAWGKLVTGRQLGNLVLTTEARVTLIDAALAGAVLIGVGLNAVFGWWWADPLAGLVIVYYGLTEGRAAWNHEDA
jgi:divalent metal cation (Fe/Co/Zn/Cd) transporter